MKEVFKNPTLEIRYFKGEIMTAEASSIDAVKLGEQALVQEGATNIKKISIAF